MRVVIGILFALVFRMYGRNLIDFFKEETLPYLAKDELGKILVFRYRLVLVCGFTSLLLLSKFSLLILLIGAMLYKQKYWSLKSLENKHRLEVLYAFPIWIRTIQCFLQNNTVVSAVKLSLDSAPMVLREDLSLLMKRLESHPESLSSYELFMERYDSLEIKKMMKQLYRYTRSGSQDRDDSMFRMVDHASAWMRTVRRNKQESLVSLYGWMGIVPVAAVSIFFVLIMFFVMISMFEGGWMI